MNFWISFAVALLAVLGAATLLGFVVFVLPVIWGVAGWPERDER